METRFVLPLTVATALHAFVLYGVKWPHAVSVDSVSTAMIRDMKPFVEVELDPPEHSASPASVPKGDPTAFRPTLPDESVSRDSIFEQPAVRTPPAPINVSSSISHQPFGDPRGIEGVDWDGVITIEGLDNPPRTRSQVAPVYPTAERKADITGEVLVEFTVDEGGRVLRPRVIRSSHTAFEASTLRAVEKWRFEPGKKNGRAVRFRMMVPVTFSLGG